MRLPPTPRMTFSPGTSPAVLQSEHPAADLYEAMNKGLWEGLAVAAAENIVTAPAPADVTARLVDMGLLHQSERPTGAGNALLLRWHRLHARNGLRRWRASYEDRRHFQRMKRLWGC